ncbi:MAG: hypothetical protein RIM84_22250 [Alphaproteobacteria bacterium]
MAIVGTILAAVVAFRFTSDPGLRPSGTALSGEPAPGQAAFEARDGTAAATNVMRKHDDV